MGVDRALLPCRRAWREFYETEQARPIAQRLNYSLVWDLDREPVGFRTTDHIVFGRHAFMRLHILNAEQRQTGMGAHFVKHVLDLRRQRADG